MSGGVTLVLSSLNSKQCRSNICSKLGKSIQMNCKYLSSSLYSEALPKIPQTFNCLLIICISLTIIILKSTCYTDCSNQRKKEEINKVCKTYVVEQLCTLLVGIFEENGQLGGRSCGWERNMMG